MLIGSAETIEQAVREFNLDWRVRRLSLVEAWEDDADTIQLLDTGILDAARSCGAG